MTSRFVVLLSISAVTLFAYQNCSTPKTSESLSYGVKSPNTSTNVSGAGVFGNNDGQTSTGYNSGGVLGCSLVADKARYQATDQVNAMVNCNFNLADTSKSYKMRWFEKDSSGAYNEILNNEFWGTGDTTGVWKMAAKDLPIGTHTRYVQVCDSNLNQCDVKTAPISFVILPTCTLTVANSSGLQLTSVLSKDTPSMNFTVMVNNATTDQLKAAKLIPKSFSTQMHYATTASTYYVPTSDYIWPVAIPNTSGFIFQLGSSALSPDQIFYIKAALFDDAAPVQNKICETSEIKLTITK